MKSDCSKPRLNELFQNLMSVVCEGIPEFRLYDTRKIAVSVARSRNRTHYGVWASVTPLRYVGGSMTRRGSRAGLSGHYAYRQPQIEKAHPDALYLMTFYVPRFFCLSPRDRIETVVHELYHLHPTLRGDLRRFAHPHMHHGPTPALFKRKVSSLAEQAIQSFPGILQHPLLSGREEDFAETKAHRYSRPRRVFEPQPGWGFKWAALLGAALWLFSTLAAHAAAPVHTLRSGTIYAQPSTGSKVMGKFSEDTRFDAVRLSPNKTWVEVRGRNGSGWIPRAWVESLRSGGSRDDLPEGATAPGVNAGEDLESESAASLDDVGSLGDDGEDSKLRAFDAKSDRYFVTQKGTLFEKPSRMASRYGVVEKDDEIMVLEKSTDGAWTRLRLLITGEEGWWPSRWIRRTKETRLGTSKPNAVEANLAWGAKEHGFGARVGYSHNILKGGLEGRPRDRFEIGAEGGFWMGKTLTYSTISAKLKFMQASVFGRYIGMSDDGHIGGGLELGVSYQKYTLTTVGITDTGILADLTDAASTSAIGLHLGVLGFYSIRENLIVILGARSHISTGPFAYAFAGAGFRF